ncbi:MAG: hypothetical protein ABI123_07545 [Ginsengibacter sp.]
MKQIILLLSILLTGYLSIAQSPDLMSYQAVIRNSTGQLISEQPVGIRIKIMSKTNVGTVVYSETHTVTTNKNGLATIKIGGGSIVSGSISSIDWSDGPYFLQTETDPAGGTAYSISFVSQMLSVPYALHAKTAGSITGTGVLPVLNGGTGQSTASNAINALVPSQSGNAGKYLSTDGASVSWENSSSGVSSFAQFYALMPGDNAGTVPTGGHVEFPQNGPSGGTDITRLNAGSFNLVSIGTYSINWQVSVDEPGQLVVALNGDELPFTVVGRYSGSSQIVGTTFITTSVMNSVLTINNPIGNIIALNITPMAGGIKPVSASLIITRLK